ncbi:hypothetical protein Flavo103_16670 [Flavobacterium collinsii]|uniref:hypothetical protein n=1 Tax=Flavobacterium collinsii TaxID=1114861 RepID=UPI0022C9E1CC|nr:hypothetical protein [Flavobacterium collinsii]GIQ58531.1 hypothetical protein Flavo103_16670 [Flavobacterium collinsii]
MDNNSVGAELVLNESARDHLKTARKWVFAISIIGLIVVLFLISSSIYSYISLSRWGNVPTGGGVGYLIGIVFTYVFFLIGVSCFFPFYYLYKFSLYLKMALDVDDSELLEGSFRYLKLHYKSIGILVLVFTLSYLLVFKVIL